MKYRVNHDQFCGQNVAQISVAKTSPKTVETPSAATVPLTGILCNSGLCLASEFWAKLAAPRCTQNRTGSNRANVARWFFTAVSDMNLLQKCHPSKLNLREASETSQTWQGNAWRSSDRFEKQLRHHFWGAGSKAGVCGMESTDGLHACEAVGFRTPIH